MKLLLKLMEELRLFELGLLSLAPFLVHAIAQEFNISLQLKEIQVALYTLVQVGLGFI
jgi:hypothetical protein